MGALINTMRKFLIVLFSSFLLCSTSFAEDIIFSPISKDNLETTARIFEPFIKLIESRTGLSIKSKYQLNYGDILADFAAGKVDLAYLGPLPIVELERKYPHVEKIATFLSEKGEPSYTCSIIRMKGDKTNMADFKGRMALTQPLSTCGLYNATQYFSRMNRDIGTVNYFFSGSHTRVVLDVMTGKAEAGSLQTSIAKNYLYQNIEIISESDPYPGFTLVANTKTLSADKIKKIKEAVLAFDPAHNAADKKTAETLGKNFRFGAVQPDESIFSRMKRDHMLLNL